MKLTKKQEYDFKDQVLLVLADYEETVDFDCQACGSGAGEHAGYKCARCGYDSLQYCRTERSRIECANGVMRAVRNADAVRENLPGTVALFLTDALMEHQRFDSNYTAGHARRSEVAARLASNLLMLLEDG